MALHKTPGVVLRRRALGEADRIVTLFTRKFGKLRAVAKGVRKPKSRLAGHLEPLHVADFVLWRREGRELALVSGADLIERHPELGNDLTTFAAAEFAAELLDKSLPDDEPHPKLYELLIRFVRALKKTEHALPALLAFTVRAADDLGWAVDSGTCGGCGKSIQSADGAWLEYKEGALFCPECESAGTNSGERLSDHALRALRSASSEPPKAVSGPSGISGASEAVRALDRLLAWHQDRRPLTSARLLNEK